MSNFLTFTKLIHVPLGWDESLWQRGVDFWKERGFRFTERRGETQTGRRGNYWGNFTSFNMSKLRATMTITRNDLTHVEFVMEVDTVGQSITEWNAAYWQKEMDTLETWLFEGDKQEEEWLEFNNRWRKAAATWAVTLGLGGNKIPPKR